MQESQQQSFEQQGPASQKSGEYSAEYPGRYGYEQQEYSEGITGDNYQQQKIHPQKEQSSRSKAFAILAIVLSSIGFFITVGGIVLSAIVLRYAHEQRAWLAGGVVGLVGSVVTMIICITIFVAAIVVLALGRRKGIP